MQIRGRQKLIFALDGQQFLFFLLTLENVKGKEKTLFCQKKTVLWNGSGYKKMEEK